RAGPEHPHREITARAGGQCAEQVDLGEELEVVPGAGGAGVHEVLAVGVQPRELGDVEHVVDVVLGQPVRQDRAGQVRVAVVVDVDAGQQPVDVGVAAGAQQVVDDLG